MVIVLQLVEYKPCTLSGDMLLHSEEQLQNFQQCLADVSKGKTVPEQ